jgi:hypothetical protein
LKISKILNELSSLQKQISDFFRSDVKPFIIKNETESLVFLNAALDNFDKKLQSIIDVFESLKLEKIYQNYSSVLGSIKNIGKYFEVTESSSVEMFS